MKLAKSSARFTFDEPSTLAKKAKTGRERPFWGAPLAVLLASRPRCLIFCGRKTAHRP